MNKQQIHVVSKVVRRPTITATAQVRLHPKPARLPAAEAAVGDVWRPEPCDALADAVVRRMLALDPALAAEAIRTASVIVVEVAGPEWVHPIAEAWRETVLGTDEVPDDGDDEASAHEGDGAWLEFRRGQGGDVRGPQDGNRRVISALRFGLRIVGFAPAPIERHLPAALVKVARKCIRLPTVTGAVLGEAVAEFIGKQPQTIIPDRLARLVSLDDLELALRPDADPDAFVERLSRIVEPDCKRGVVPLDRLKGMREAVDWGFALAEDLAAFSNGSIAWSDVDRGCLLVGPPGVGKTTFAASVASWCGVPLLVGSLSKWQATGDGHLGHCLAAMRSDFDAARACTPCILLIDELDGFCNRRTARGGNRDYHVQVVNALLEQLDGVEGRDGVVVIAACNDVGRLDPAIYRSGRLDRSIHVAPPDGEALEGIVRHHLGHSFADVDLSGVAFVVAGATGADVERWARAARRMARRARREVTLGDFIGEAAEDRPLLDGPSLWRVAVHEAGHAVLACLERPGSLVSVAIHRSGPARGVMKSRPVLDPMTARDFGRTLRILLAGRAAEEVILGEASAGAGGNEESDLARATMLILGMARSFGLSPEMGLTWAGSLDGVAVGSMLASDPVLAAHANTALADAYAEVAGRMRLQAPLVEAVAAKLVANGSVAGWEVEDLVGNAKPEPLA